MPKTRRQLLEEESAKTPPEVKQRLQELSDSMHRAKKRQKANGLPEPPTKAPAARWQR